MCAQLCCAFVLANISIIDSREQSCFLQNQNSVHSKCECTFAFHVGRSHCAGSVFRNRCALPINCRSAKQGREIGKVFALRHEPKKNKHQEEKAAKLFFKANQGTG